MRADVAGVALLCGLACATTPTHSVPEQPTPTPAPIVTPAAAPAPPPATCKSFAGPGVLRRSLVSRTVDAGLGRWLAGVDVAPSVRKGRFRGWLIRSLYPDDICYRDVDIRPGDVVVRVNGKSAVADTLSGALLTFILTRINYQSKDNWR